MPALVFYFPWSYNQKILATVSIGRHPVALWGVTKVDILTALMSYRLRLFASIRQAFLRDSGVVASVT